jgi:4a-hydroxytetrahydrobiopterin dehydratase
MSLLEQKCVPCEGGTMPLTIPEAQKLLQEIPSWTLSPDVKNLSKSFKFKDFAEALAFTNKVGAIAEGEGHHPDIDLHWGRVGVSLTTHAIGGLSVNDFILAAKVEKLMV